MTYDDDESPMVEGSYRSKNRRCCIVSALSVTLALILVLAIAIPVGMNHAKKGNSSNGGVSAACAATSYPDRCNQEMQSSDGSYQGMSKVGLLSSDQNLANLQTTTNNSACQEVLEQARDSIAEVFNATVYGTPASLLAACADVQTKLSAAIEQVGTCQDILTQLQAPELQAYPIIAENATELLSIVLAITNAFCKYGTDLSQWLDTTDLPDEAAPSPEGRRRLLEYASSVEDTAFPSWMDSATRRHLLSRPSSYNVIVAQDGSGRYRTVMDAINRAPQSGKLNAPRYIIYVKAGVYDEQIIVPKKLTNLLIIGDGIDQTIFTGSRSVAGIRGMTTFLSGTLLVSGATGFIGKFFTVRNTAGSVGQQACAVRVSADQVAFYQVKFDSYQDTLYAHTFRQFYSQCIVQGTVDFMFGNSNTVFQGCTLVAKNSQLIGQQNTYTAQGRTDPHQNTGLAFQDCNFVGTPYLVKNIVDYPTYLGRPWKQYSVCVLLRATLQSHINPTGWLPWNTTSFGLYTSFFAEYRSKGPGSNTRYRVKWSHQITDPRTANHYQAGSFIQGQSWLPSLGIPYSLAAV